MATEAGENEPLFIKAARAAHAARNAVLEETLASAAASELFEAVLDCR